MKTRRGRTVMRVQPAAASASTAASSVGSWFRKAWWNRTSGRPSASVAHNALISVPVPGSRLPWPSRTTPGEVTGGIGRKVAELDARIGAGSANAGRADITRNGWFALSLLLVCNRNMSFWFVLPLLCGLAFPVVAWLLKRGMELSRDPWGVLMVSSAAAAVPFVVMFVVVEGGGHAGMPDVPALLTSLLSRPVPLLALACGAFF